MKKIISILFVSIIIIYLFNNLRITEGNQNNYYPRPRGKRGRNKIISDNQRAPLCKTATNIFGPQDLKQEKGMDIDNADPNVSPNNYCGGGNNSDNVEAQRRCTPFMYVPFVQDYSGASFTGKNINKCGNNGVDFATGFYNDKTKGHMVWAAYTSINGILRGSRQNIPYFVFHSYDGSGIEDDCLGDIWYVESFGDCTTVGLNNKCLKEPTPRKYGGDSSLNKRENSPIHKFIHPGTEIGYKDYFSGWLWGDEGCGTPSFGAGKNSQGREWEQDVDLIKNKFQEHRNNLNTKNGSQNDKTNDINNIFQFCMFPWVCAKDSSKLGNNFMYPHITEVSSGYKCYADNEPGQIGIPPIIRLFSMKYSNDSINNEPYLNVYISTYNYYNNSKIIDGGTMYNRNNNNIVTIPSNFRLYECSDGSCSY